MSLTVRATKKEKNTEFYLRQDGYKTGIGWDWYYDAVNEAWPVVVNGLKDYLEKGMN